MIPGVMALFLLISDVEAVQCSLGVPVTIDYSIPEGFVPYPLEVTDDFFLLEQNGDSITIVPMVLDTLILPPLYALSDSLEMDFSAPHIEVVRTMPDTTWTVPVFPSPLNHRIPPGFAEDYLDRHRFWERWGRVPSNMWLLPAILLLAAVIAVLIVWLIQRKRKTLSTTDASSTAKHSISPLDEVQALLDSKAFADGRWIEYYRDVDRLLRDTVAFRFAISNRAYTWHQIRRQLSREKGGREFIDDSSELSKEITLQRYASWGGSRERAKRYTSSLLSLRREWHR
ncbi:MAG: hypothetical protein K8S15_11540 [Candidatus Aegiribacteria sp.]|nr:hypothetical protein [Candidatus Aegiribacteria sp.]